MNSKEFLNAVKLLKEKGIDEDTIYSAMELAMASAYKKHSGLENVRVETDATDNYYNASDTTQLKNAVTSIFQKIVQALGVGSVSITDGTTSTVVSENAVSHLLDVDDESFEYWLTVPIVNNEFKRVDLVSGDEIDSDFVSMIINGKV